MRFSFKEFLIGLILKDAKGTFIWCDHCGSPFTRFYDVNKTRTKDFILVDYHIECLKCGAHARMIETWDKSNE